jgi:phosphoserine phosphatase
MTPLDRALPDLPAPSPPAAVLAAIAALPAGAWIATDADETLWAADVGDEVVRLAAAATPPWAAGSADFAWYAREMAEGDYAGACRYAARVLALAPAAAAAEALQPVLAAVQLRRWLAEALRAAMARGVEVVVVSASPQPVVRQTAALLGLPVRDVLGIEMDDRQAAVVEPAPVGWGKVEAWRRRGWAAPDLALGDSRWDAPLLVSARQGLLLPKASLDPLRDTPQERIG